MDDLESDDESVDTPFVSPFLDSDDEPDGGEVLNGNFVAYFDPFLPMNIITRKAYNTIMVERLEREFIVSDMTDIVIGRPFRAITKLEYDCVKGLISFSKIFDTYIFLMPRTIPRLKNIEWSKVSPILVLSQRDLMSGLKYSNEKNKLVYKNCLNLGHEYQVDEDMKEWLTRGHVGIDGVTQGVIFDKEKPESSLDFRIDDS
nr:glycosyl transferase, family 8 [Tanacetum cinerariifolium]